MKIKLVLAGMLANWRSVDRGLFSLRFNIGEVKIGRWMTTQLMREYQKSKVGKWMIGSRSA